MNSEPKIGVMDASVTNLNGGPKVFMLRLKEAIIKKEIYSENEFNKWINLSFKEIPKFVENRLEEVALTVRFDGIWNTTFIPRWFFPKIARNVNTIVFKQLNKTILNNYKLADRVIYQSEFSKFQTEKLLFERFKLNVPPKESTIIYNGVDLERFKPMKGYRDEESFPNILISHRLAPSKRAHQAYLIIERLIKQYPNLKVHVVGGGIRNPFHFGRDSRAEMIKDIRKRGLSKYFVFHGYIEPEQLAKTYNKCDFMLNLSYADPCPNVVVEAMACGLPVIAPNHGGIPELVGDHRLLIDEAIDVKDFQSRYVYQDIPLINPNEYEKKIMLLLQDLDYYSVKMRTRAEQYFNISKVADQYIEFVCK